MKKYILLLVMCIFTMFLVGCGKEEKTSTINCTYTTTENDINLIVDMIFVRDNEKEVISDGKFIMTYMISGLEILEESERNTYLNDMFDGVCDDLSYLYSGCDVKLLDNGAEIINTFDLDELESSSSGKFKRSHTLKELEDYILKQNDFEGMTCKIQ